jgi:hypothetical protein
MVAAMSVDRSEGPQIDHDVPLAMLATVLAAILLVASFLFINQQHQETAALLPSTSQFLKSAQN